MTTNHLTSRYDHLMADFGTRPLELARHLRDEHGIEPRPARKRYEREVWHSQHEYEGHPTTPSADQCGRLTCDQDATHELISASGFRASLCDADTEWWAGNRSDPVESIRCLADTTHGAAAMPGECTCR